MYKIVDIWVKKALIYKYKKPLIKSALGGKIYNEKNFNGTT